MENISRIGYLLQFWSERCSFWAHFQVKTKHRQPRYGFHYSVNSKPLQDNQNRKTQLRNQSRDFHHFSLYQGGLLVSTDDYTSHLGLPFRPVKH
jgi:hypothetical protein